jgi:hypothetical protein
MPDRMCRRLGSDIRGRWDGPGTFYADLGYSHNTPVQNTPGSDLGVSAFSSSYNEGSAGFILRKHLGREYDFFAAYQLGFSELGLDGYPALSSGKWARLGWNGIPVRLGSNNFWAAEAAGLVNRHG